MRELNENEIKEVNGGAIPLIGLAASAAGHFMARSFGSWAVSRIGTITAVYGAAEYFSAQK
ncbi:MAG: class IIb bacteriocin, lactobin A/cerein 7B family [Colwellia sp.]